MKASLVDTHTHIYYHSAKEELAHQMDRCIEAGVDRLILPNVDLNSISLVFDATAAYPDHCFAMLGLHPCSVKEDYQKVLLSIEKEIPEREILAIGEIGLDLYWDKTGIDQQIDAFKQQLQWAKDLGLPVSIHCREAFDEILPILREEQDGRLKGVLHCFTGNSEQASKILDTGLLLGIGGVVTFKKAGLDLVVKDLDLSHIVLETDAPYLAPSPYRGKQNESSYLKFTAQKIADLHEVSLEIVAEITTRNAEKLFNLKSLND